ncbi:hypothetical protein PVK06_004127 [Gossypium arboreum]|uniref:Uncharacterized protein n=1 Tax=Gossypium arboreum TaxID=29729 RepID=A0ABR0QS42_GOSAR|nr:hypothetical protein PVK06_004127 [Gossypium arboreum]
MVNRKEVVDVVASIVTGLIDNEFNESEEEIFGFDVFDNGVSNRVRVNLDGLNMDDIEVGELSNSDDSKRLNNTYESDSNGHNWLEFNLDSDMSNPKLQVGMLISTKDNLKDAARQYCRLNNYFIKFPKNDLKRLKAVWSSNYSWHIWASRLHRKQFNLPRQLNNNSD